MDFYNTKYVCSYNNSDVFLESELEILNDEYLEYKENRERLMNGITSDNSTSKNTKSKKVISKGTLKIKVEA